MSDNLSHMLNFTFEKNSDVLIEKAKVKVFSLRSKVEEREARVLKVRKEYNIDDQAMFTLVNDARKRAPSAYANSTYALNNAANPAEQVVVGAGVVANILGELDLIESEKSQISKLETIARNLKDLADDNGIVRGHRLSFDELKYLGF